MSSHDYPYWRVLRAIQKKMEFLEYKRCMVPSKLMFPYAYLCIVDGRELMIENQLGDYITIDSYFRKNPIGKSGEDPLMKLNIALYEKCLKKAMSSLAMDYLAEKSIFGKFESD